MSVRLEEKPFQVGERTYMLRCNMAVLDALEERFGDFGAVVNLSARTGAAEIFAAMLNDYAEDQGWETDWTAAKVKKRFSWADLLDADVMGIFSRAVIPASAAGKATQPDKPGNSGN